MSAAQRKPKEMARGERVLPGVWRLRLPLPWPGVPHGNAWAVAAGDGIVLFDTGYADEDGTRQLEDALAQVGFGLADVDLVVCTHAHTDHYGLAGPIVDAAGCDLWMHPAWGHVRRLVEDPDGAFDHRIEIARQGGVPQVGLEMYEKRRGANTGIVRLVEPAVDLLPGVEVETDLGSWQVHETPGHAPSHVVLHQPESGLLISGDHLLGRISLFFDHGHTPDPVAEFLGGLATVEELETSLCLPGHGRPFRQIPGKVRATRDEVHGQRARVLASIAAGPKTAFETVPDLIGRENLNPGTTAWGLQLAFAYLDHLTLAGELIEEPESEPRRWQAA